MGLQNLNDKLKIFLKNKNFANALIAVLVIIFLWLAGSTFLGGEMKNSNKNSVPRGAQEVVTNDGTSNNSLIEYEIKQRDEVEEILKKMDGVGEVDVMLYFESSEVQVPAFNSTTQVLETKEEDGQGGTRTTNQETGGNNVVMRTNGSSNEPFIVKTYKPPITGVLIVAEGAGNNKIKYDIQVSIANLYNLSLDKVNVYPMK